MGLSLVTGPTTEPVTLAETKAHLRVDIAEDDGLIAGYILAARRYAEGYTRRAFMTQTWDYTIDYAWPSTNASGYCTQRITLPLPPLQSVASISYVDTDGNTQTLSSDQYLVKTDDTSGVIEPAYGVTWPDIRYQIWAVTVRFVAGWAQIPDEIRMAILLLVGHWYENRETVNVGNLTTELPFTVEALLSPYRVIRIL
jgi:uncharacterized phiE125 gp8 family phage protein